MTSDFHVLYSLKVISCMHQWWCDNNIDCGVKVWKCNFDESSINGKIDCDFISSPIAEE